MSEAFAGTSSGIAGLITGKILKLFRPRRRRSRKVANYRPDLNLVAVTPWWSKTCSMRLTRVYLTSPLEYSYGINSGLLSFPRNTKERMI